MSVPINLDWGQFKTFVNQFFLTIDYAPEGINYFLFSSNGSVMLSAYITDPTDVADFESNYKPFAFEVSIPPNGGGPGTLVVQGTTPWVCSIGAIALPVGAAIATKQDTGNASLASIDSKTPAAGQALMAASSPVVLASNQSAIPVSQSGGWTVAAMQSGLWSTSVAGTVSTIQSGVWSVAQSGVWAVSVTGVATETTLAALNVKTPTLGQAAMSASRPVVIASNQSSIPTNIASGYTHINFTGTALIKSGPGILHRVIINDTGGGLYTFYDNTVGSGPVIAVMKPSVISTLTYGLRFTTGLTVVIAGGAGDTTITFE